MSETISNTLHRAIIEGERAGATLTEINISDTAALELARELTLSRLHPDVSAMDLYRQMKAGNSKFMNRAIIVADPDTDPLLTMNASP